MSHFANVVTRFGSIATLLLFLSCGLGTAQSAPSLLIKSAAYNKKAASLIVKTSTKDQSGLLTLLHNKGGVLGQTTDSEHTFTVPLTQLGDIPCRVEARLGGLKTSKAVTGAGIDCNKTPMCKIIAPKDKLTAKANEPIAFTAQVTLKDMKAAPLTIEWDFAGGVMAHPYGKLLKANNKPIISEKVKTQATFVRDNSRYHVRFAAMDALGRRCEDSIEVSIGTPPTNLPPKVSEQQMPQRGGALSGIADELVALPFEDLTMQSYTDARLAPNQYVTIRPFSTLNALIYRKARLPVLLQREQAEVFYSAASNPADPAGADAINSTSQNWPAGNTYLDAQLQKTDMFEPLVPDDPKPDDINLSFIGSLGFDFTALPDEGFDLPLLYESDHGEHGSFMPGIDAPYFSNDPQAFRVFDPVLTVFKAWMLPLTDIDDSGRVNPYPLLRIEAKSVNDATTTTTDAVLTSGRDLHCRECHEKGGIAADPKTQMAVRFYQASTGGGPGTPTNKQPTFFAATSERIDDREYAAYLNIASIHDFYDGIGLLDHALGGDGHSHHGGSSGPQFYVDLGCNSCHSQWQNTAAGTYGGSSVQRNVYGRGYDTSAYSKSARFEGGRAGIVGYDNSSAIHTMHGQFIYNADKSGIRRQPSGRFERWHPEDGPNPSPLFPVKDATGKILPMEDNCLKCHGGKREQCYRDRMYTAGVTCYQCHGDMLAVGGFYKQASLSPDGHDRRLPWLDQPDCGACHIGNGNLGKDRKNDFFSAGVMNTAFAAADPAATQRTPTDGPDGARFAIPRVTMALEYRISQATQTDQGVGQFDSYSERGFNILQTPLFRLAKDTHGNVPCAACHGAAHAVWPNRDPNANDNVTALQLQGHTGTILECSVCHSADAFKNEADLDGGIYSGDSQTGILGGPHNTHPINDAYWWQTTDGDTMNADATSYGGWHNNYAQQPGKNGEDQCASCHGNDHKGTRLSKTPVDRVFDFSGPAFNFAQLKKAGFKKKIIKVAANTSIGCDTCHSIKTSCINSPNPNCGSSQGKLDPINHAPVFTSTPVVEVTLGQPYRATVSATDPDGDPVTLRLSWTSWAGNEGTLDFDANTGELSANWATQVPQYGEHWLYTVTADDGKGHLTDQTVAVNLVCPNGLLRDSSLQSCVKTKITSEQPTRGINAGQTFTYQVTALNVDGQPLSYALNEDAPKGMTITPNGLVSWSNSDISEETDLYAEVVATDGKGNEARQGIGFRVCIGSQHWNDIGYNCEGFITIGSSAPGNGNLGMDVGQTLIQHVEASHEQNLPLSFSLSGGPTSMQIDASGHLEWTADDESAGTYYVTLSVSDGQGGLAKQAFQLTVCALPSHWVAENGECTDTTASRTTAAAKTAPQQPTAGAPSGVQRFPLAIQSQRLGQPLRH